MKKWLFGLILLLIIVTGAAFAPYFSGKAAEKAIFHYITAANYLHPEILSIDVTEYQRHYAHSDATLTISIPHLQQHFDIHLRISHGPIINQDNQWRIALSRVEVSLSSSNTLYQDLNPTLILGFNDKLALINKENNSSSEINIKELVAYRSPGYEHPQIITYNIAELTSLTLDHLNKVISHRESKGITLTSESKMTYDDLPMGNWMLAIDHKNDGRHDSFTKLNTEEYDSQYLLEARICNNEYDINTIIKHRMLKIFEVPEINGPVNFRMHIKHIDRNFALKLRNFAKNLLDPNKQASLTINADLEKSLMKDLSSRPLSVGIQLNWKTKHGSLSLRTHIKTTENTYASKNNEEFLRGLRANIEIDVNRGFLEDFIKFYNYLIKQYTDCNRTLLPFTLQALTMQNVDDAASKLINAGYIQNQKSGYTVRLKLSDGVLSGHDANHPVIKIWN